ncbi:MAG: hypothetical protein ACOYN4_15710 [Bacteroidales bacterium]
MKTSAMFLISVFVVIATIKTAAQVTAVKPNPKSSVSKDEASQRREKAAPSLGGGTASDRIQLQGVEGDIYIGGNWPSGIVSLRNGQTIDNYNLRYNLLADQMQFVSGLDTLAFASPQELKTVSFDGRTFVYETYQCENMLRQGYFELLVSGKNRLLLKRAVTYEMPDALNPEAKNETTYLIDECFFISKPGQPASKLICNRKNALSVLNEHQDEIDDYMRITGNKVRSKEDLVKLVTYYNALEQHE